MVHQYHTIYWSNIFASVVIIYHFEFAWGIHFCCNYVIAMVIEGIHYSADKCLLDQNMTKQT